MQHPRAVLKSLFAAAVAATDPDRCLLPFMPAAPKGRTIVIGAGKGVAQLARAFEKNWPHQLEGVVVTRYGYGVSCERIEVLYASHPLPDEAGLYATERIFETVSRLSADDLVIALFCGGGSSLLPAPPLGLTLADEIALNRILLESGAPISAMNTIRKHASRIKGGRLALSAAPARVISLVVSDIPGDVAAFVSSGPTVPDHTTRSCALAAIDRYRIDLPNSVRRYIETPSANAPSADAAAFARNETYVIASSSISLEAAAEEARRQGFRAAILSDSIEGEAREAARFHAALAREIAMRNRPFERPVVILSGGETTVTLKGSGKGGRNSEFALSFALDVERLEGVHALAADTDGIDGSEDNAGAFADYTTVARLRASGADPEALLLNNDAWTAFSQIGDIFVSGPTGTNVNDFRAVLIE